MSKVEAEVREVMAEAARYGRSSWASYQSKYRKGAFRNSSGARSGRVRVYKLEEVNADVCDR